MGEPALACDIISNCCTGGDQRERVALIKGIGYRARWRVYSSELWRCGQSDPLRSSRCGRLVGSEPCEPVPFGTFPVSMAEALMAVTAASMCGSGPVNWSSPRRSTTTRSSRSRPNVDDAGAPDRARSGIRCPTRG